MDLKRFYKETDTEHIIKAYKTSLSHLGLSIGHNVAGDMSFDYKNAIADCLMKNVEAARNCMKGPDSIDILEDEIAFYKKKFDGGFVFPYLQEMKAYYHFIFNFYKNHVLNNMLLDKNLDQEALLIYNIASKESQALILKKIVPMQYQGEVRQKIEEAVKSKNVEKLEKIKTIITDALAVSLKKYVRTINDRRVSVYLFLVGEGKNDSAFTLIDDLSSFISENFKIQEIQSI